jgi:pimeloyl-ACP methyl ester carboxylesterase
MRRGIDLLVSREDIDPIRLGYVGFSWGGSVGAIFAGVERRVSSFVLMSAVPRLSADMRRLGEEQGANDLAGYEEAMRPIDAVNYLPHAAPNALFFQFGKEDTRPSPDEGRQAAASASAPKLDSLVRRRARAERPGTSRPAELARTATGSGVGGDSAAVRREVLVVDRRRPVAAPFPALGGEGADDAVAVVNHPLGMTGAIDVAPPGGR